MASNSTKIANLVKNINIVNNLGRMFNLKLEPFHYADKNISYNEALYKSDNETVNYILYRHPVSVLWKKPHPSNTQNQTNSALSK